jgi:hypothetical protein
MSKISQNHKEMAREKKITGKISLLSNNNNG